jgi:hypothetical protein
MLRVEHRLWVFENRVLRKIFGTKREEVAGGRGILHNNELHNFYTSPNIIKVSKSRRIMSGAYSMQGRDEKCI